MLAALLLIEVWQGGDCVWREVSQCLATTTGNDKNLVAGNSSKGLFSRDNAFWEKSHQVRRWLPRNDLALP